MPIQPAEQSNPQSEIRTPKSHRFSGDFVGRVTPVPIPNTEVKPAGADGTARVTVWESRKSPGLFNEARLIQFKRAFLRSDLRSQIVLYRSLRKASVASTSFG